MEEPLESPEEDVLHIQEGTFLKIKCRLGHLLLMEDKTNKQIYDTSFIYMHLYSIFVVIKLN